MEKKFVLEYNCETGETTEREFTAEEYAQAEEDALAYAQAEAERLAAEEAKASKKASVLAIIAEVTGLTAEDISEALTQ